MEVPIAASEYVVVPSVVVAVGAVPLVPVVQEPSLTALPLKCVIFLIFAAPFR